VTDYAILGFLMSGPKSGYDIRRCMSVSTAHFYKASFGSIYPALGRMASEALIEARPSEVRDRRRLPYAILPAGEKVFLAWLGSPLDIASGPSALLIRVFFLGCLSPLQASETIAAYAEAAGERRKWLSGALENLPAEPDFYQSSTQAFGLEYYAFLESWLERLASTVAEGAAKPPVREKDKEGL
jgi:Predicted transcriptional regulators